MAWSTGSFGANAVGNHIGVLDVKLLENAKWIIYDAAAGLTPGNLVLNGTFATNDYTSWTAGANWSAATGVSKRTPAASTTVTQNITLKIGYYYDAVLDVSLRTAGTLTVSMTNTTGGPLVISADGNYTIHFYCTAAAAVLTFTPDANFDGAFDNVTLNQVLTNCKVYQCSDAGSNCLFYVKVDDQHLGFAVIELWEGWNSGTHIGTGAFLKTVGSSVDLRITSGAGGYGISVRNHCFIWQDNFNTTGSYIGQPRRKDVSKNIVVFCGQGSSANYPGLAKPGNDAYTSWGSLFDELGNKVNLGFPASDGTAYRLKTILGELELRETPLVNLTTFFIMGELEGVASYGNSNVGVVTGDTCVIGGVTWGCQFSAYLCWIEHA